MSLNILLRSTTRGCSTSFLLHGTTRFRRDLHIRSQCQLRDEIEILRRAQSNVKLFTERAVSSDFLAACCITLSVEFHECTFNDLANNISDDVGDEAQLSIVAIAS